jgi:shikimate kinase
MGSTPLNIEKNIVLTGFMGTYKSTVGSILSSDLGFTFTDIDSLIEQNLGKTIAEIFESEGEPAFRKYESQTIEEVSKKNKLIISCGGGAVLNEQNIINLKEKGIIILLEANANDIYKRVSGNTARPLLKNKMSVSTIQNMLNERYSYYHKYAEIIIDTSGKSSVEVVNELLGAMKR